MGGSFGQVLPHGQRRRNVNQGPVHPAVVRAAAVGQVKPTCCDGAICRELHSHRVGGCSVISIAERRAREMRNARRAGRRTVVDIDEIIIGLGGEP